MAASAIYLKCACEVLYLVFIVVRRYVVRTLSPNKGNDESASHRFPMTSAIFAVRGRGTWTICLGIWEKSIAPNRDRERDLK